MPLIVNQDSPIFGEHLTLCSLDRALAAFEDPVLYYCFWFMFDMH